jgi:hypothetical protein
VGIDVVSWWKHSPLAELRLLWAVCTVRTPGVPTAQNRPGSRDSVSELGRVDTQTHLNPYPRRGARAGGGGAAHLVQHLAFSPSTCDTL